MPGRCEVSNLVRSFAPNVVHVATEGPVGLAVRAFRVRNGWQFTWERCTDQLLAAFVPVR